MKRNLPKKLLSLLLSAMLVVTVPDVTTVRAAEPSASVETEAETASNASQNETPIQPQAVAEAASDESQAVTEAASDESQTETEADSDESQTETEPDADEPQTEAEAASDESQAVTEPDADEPQTEAEAASDESQSAAESNADESQAASESVTDESQTETESLPGFSLFEVNPLYADLLDASQAEKQVESRALLAEPREEADCQTLQEAADHLRQKMLAREGTVVIHIPAKALFGYTFETFFDAVFEAAYEYSDACSGQESDALRWATKTRGIEGTSPDQENYRLVFTITYHSTAAQEEALTTAVNDALKELTLDGKSDYEKVRAIHDYICDHVNYDNSLKKYSAYDALCTGTSVCQGYAVLFYRMCKDAGLSVRIISGIGNGGNHGWNIVKISDSARAAGQYYNVDCTWDGQSDETHHSYFLKCDADFINHTRDAEYNTAEFLAAFPMTEASYVFSKSMNVPNINLKMDHYQGESADDYFEVGDSVYTSAQGKPKVIAIVQNTCTRSQETVREIAENDFGDVDLYVVLGLAASDDSIPKFKSFIDTYAPDCRHITFAFNTTNPSIPDSYLPGPIPAPIDMTPWDSYMELAVEHLGWAQNEPTPILVYIDANDKVQHMTKGRQTANAIKQNLQTFCGGEGGDGGTFAYTITYNLNGGTNHTGNPSAYTASSAPITLLEPVKEGCVFLGWYTDAAMTNKITQITKDNTGNLTLYAKWEDSSQEPVDPSETYTITYELDGGVNHADNPATYTTMTETIILKAPAKEGYTFDGWYIDAAKTNKITQITKDNTGNLTLYAKWTENQTSDDSDPTVEPKYTVTFDINGHGSAPQSVTGIKSGELIQKPADPTAQGYRFDGWYKDSSCSTAWNFSTDKVTADTTLYAKWVKLDTPADEDVSKYPDDQRKDLKAAGAKIAEIKSKVYDGNPYTPVVKVTVSDGGRQLTLTEGADYRVLYTNNIIPGTAKVTVRGNGTYKGEITKEFQITKKPLKALKVVAGGMSADDRTDNLPVYLYDGAAELVKGTDYTLSGLTDVKGSTAKVTATAAKNSKYYEGSATTKITLYRADADKIINAEHVTLSAKSVPFTGKAVTDVVPTVKIGGVTLVKNKQYKVRFKDNTKAGTALVIITGKGAYKGKVIKSFTIEPSKSKFTVSRISDKTYNGKLQKPSVTVKDGTRKLKVNRDYTVTYAKNLSAGKASVTITGIGNYAGSAPETITFTIQPQKISKASVKGTVSNGVTLTYNKKPLVEGVDYQLTCGAERKGKIQLTITGLNNDFTGTMTKTIRK